MSIYDDIKNGKYENKIERVFYLKSEKLSDEEREVKRAQNDAYWKEVNRLGAQFKTDALAYVNMTKHPRGLFAFKKAWRAGHLEGIANIWRTSHSKNLVAVIDELIELAYIAGAIDDCGVL